MSEPKPPTEQQIIQLCNQLSTVENQLGMFADYEGGKDGPTWYIWNKGKESFQSRCLQGIKLHHRAIRLWRRLQKLNETRTDTPPGTV